MCTEFKVHTKVKVQIFWEGRKNLRNRPHGFDIHYVNFKTIKTIAHIFVAFSEKLNFMTLMVILIEKKPQVYITKAELLQEGIIFLIHLFAISLMKKLKIEETKAT